MIPPPESVRRHFLPWNRPLLPQAAAWLAAAWDGTGPLDLADRLVIVPTRQSGRRLREALAGFAAQRRAAVFPPRVLLPEALAAPAAARDVAPRLASLLAWAEVVREVPLEDFRAVFPVDPPARNFAWGLRLAEELVHLQRALAESGLRLADVAGRVGGDFPEIDRWREIAALERRHDEALAARGWRDAPAVRIAAAGAPELPAGVRRIIVLAVPDPQPLALAALARLAAQVPVDVVVYAPATEAAAFDGWGRPLAAVWGARVLELPNFEARVRLCADPAAQAERIATLAKGYGSPEGALGVGIADPEVLPLAENALEQADLATFNPEGRRRRGDALYQLLTALATLAREEAFAAVEALARCPDFLKFLRGRIGVEFSAAGWLGELDQLHLRHLPPTLAEARRHAPTQPGLALTAEVRAILRTGAFPENAVAALAAIFAGRRFDLTRPDEARVAEAAEAWTSVLRELAAAAEAFGGLAPADGWELALRAYGDSVRYDDKPAGAVELQGWLELLWEDAPHLVVAGFNDGRVPEAIVGDPFLPETLRERLGLKTNAARLARDAYALQAIAAWRGGGGTRLDLLFGKTSVVGDPLRPSRLLLRCEDAALPARIAFLFRPAESTRAAPAWRRAWRLTPPTVARALEGRRRVAVPAKVAVTGLRAWLACPLRFYLQRVLGMEAVDPEKTELDVFDFGTLCHAALEAMGREPALRDATDPARLREFLLGILELEASRRFGAALALPLVVQLESARQRLSRAAEVQAQTRADGWVIEDVERPFEIDVGGLAVRGKIDRIDRHEVTGARRVLDYKTSDRPVEPWQAHLRGARREETAPEFARFIAGGKEQVWTDLQLPLYRRALEVERVDPNALSAPGALGSTRSTIECGYFNLPKAVGETGIRPWLKYTRELDAAAWRCALGVAAAIRAGEFWPPNETLRPEQDDFAALFHHGVADSVAWEEAP